MKLDDLILQKVSHLSTWLFVENIVTKTSDYFRMLFSSKFTDLHKWGG